PIRPPPRSTPFPYTTLFRSRCHLLARGKVSGHGPVDFTEGFRLHRNETRCCLFTVRLRLGDCSLVLIQHGQRQRCAERPFIVPLDRKSTRLNSSHRTISYAV